MGDNELADVSTATILMKFLQAINLLGEVYNSDTDFSRALAPACTEKFLTECGERIDMITTALEESVDA